MTIFGIVILSTAIAILSFTAECDAFRAFCHRQRSENLEAIEFEGRVFFKAGMVGFLFGLLFVLLKLFFK